MYFIFWLLIINSIYFFLYTYFPCYRNTIDICMPILYTMTLLPLLIIANDFGGKFLQIFLCIQSCYLQKQIAFFQISTTFISISCLLQWPELPALSSIKVLREDILALYLNIISIMSVARFLQKLFFQIEKDTPLRLFLWMGVKFW